MEEEIWPSRRFFDVDTLVPISIHIEDVACIDTFKRDSLLRPIKPDPQSFPTRHGELPCHTQLRCDFDDDGSGLGPLDTGLIDRHRHTRQQTGDGENQKKLDQASTMLPEVR